MPSDLAHEVAIRPDEARARIEKLYRQHGCHLPDVAQEIGLSLVQLYKHIDKLAFLPRLHEIRDEAKRDGWLKVVPGRGSGGRGKPKGKKRKLTAEHKARISRAMRRTA